MSSKDTATFTGTTLTLTDQDSETANGWEQTFSDAAMPFTELILQSDNFSPDITYSLSGGVITVDWVGTFDTGVTYTAVFDIAGGSATPEPSSIALFGTGFAFVVNQLRRKRAA